MRIVLLAFAAFLLSGANLLSTEVEVVPSASSRPTQTQSFQTPSPTPAVVVPQYRPALFVTGPLSVVNRIDTQELARKGQKDASLMFCCSVKETGEVLNTWIYRVTPGSTELEQEVFKCLDTAAFIPAIYNRQPVHVLFFGTVNFKMVNGKPRLRIFANQEAEEFKKESDFVGPQPFAGRGSSFEGLHYPDDVLTMSISGLVELAMKIDADGNLKDLKVVSEYPPLVGFGRAAVEDFRVAKFIPAFRNGKPVECSVTLPIYYEP